MSRQQDKGISGRKPVDHRLVAAVRMIIAEARAKAQITAERLGRTGESLAQDVSRRAR